MQIEPGENAPRKPDRLPGRCVFKKWMRRDQIMLACQQSGAVRPIMVTTVGATLARP